MDKSIDSSGLTLALPHVMHVGPLRPFVWLRGGWEDVTHNPGPSFAHGLLLVALGCLVLFMCSTHIDLFAAAVSGFLLMGPVFGAGFYALSQLRAAGQPATFGMPIEFEGKVSTFAELEEALNGNHLPM